MAFIFPDSKSGNNTYCFDCKAVDRVSNYAVCQFVIEAYMAGKQEVFLECAAKIKDKTCPAIRMIAEEKKAGKTLYWEDRISARVELKKLPRDDTPAIPDFLRREPAPDSILDRSAQKAAWGFPPDDGVLAAIARLRPKGRVVRSETPPAKPPALTISAPKPTDLVVAAVTAAQTDYAKSINSALQQEK